MSTTFAEIVEEVKFLSTQEKHELQQLIERFLVEKRKDEIYESYGDALSELDGGQVDFTSDMDNLRGQLLND